MFTNNNGHFDEWVIYSLLKKTYTKDFTFAYALWKLYTQLWKSKLSFLLEIKAFTNQANIQGVFLYIET